LDETTGDRLGPSGLRWCGLPDLVEELAQVLIRCRLELPATQLDTHRFLEELGSGKAVFLDCSMEIVG
jgi:hypothetical protein